MSSRIEQLTRMLQAEPEDTFCLYSLGQEHAKAGNLRDAVGFYDRAIAIDPGMCYAYFHKARCLEEADDVAGAVETLRAGLTQAKKARDQKAASELQGYLDSLT